MKFVPFVTKRQDFEEPGKFKIFKGAICDIKMANSFETGLQQLNLYVSRESFGHKMVTLSQPHFFELCAKVENAFQLLGELSFSVERDEIDYQIMDDNDVLRLEEEECLTIRLHEEKKQPASIVLLRYCPLNEIDPRSRSEEFNQEKENSKAVSIESLLELCDDTDAMEEQGKMIVDQFKTHGYIRLQQQSQTSYASTYKAALLSSISLFDLPEEVKLHSRSACQDLSFSTANSNYQHKIGYGKPSTAFKEYFIHRNLMFPSYSLKQQQVYFGSSLPHFKHNVDAFFHYCQMISKMVATCVLTYLGLKKDQIKTLLTKSSEPVSPSSSDVAFHSMMECFKYQIPTFKVASNTSKTFVACAEHGDVSLLTCIPQCHGTAGLQIMSWKNGFWNQVEKSFDCLNSNPTDMIVFPGEQMQRISNGFISPSQHRVFFLLDQPSSNNDNKTENNSLNEVRYSFPFELLLSPDSKIDCKTWLDETIVGPISETYSKIETVKEAVMTISKNLISVNK
jgi:isopenicillin N synthase-like dioxygenase